MHKIKVTKIDHSFGLGNIENNPCLTMESPAVDVMTDFHKSEPLVIDSSMNIIEAEKLMVFEHSRLKIIVNKDNKMVGVITLSDFLGERPVLLAKEKSSKADILVSELMTPIDEINALTLSELKVSKVQDVISLLQKEHWQYIFVVEEDKKQVCGLMTASDVAKKIGSTVKVDRTPTFHSIFSEIL